MMSLGKYFKFGRDTGDSPVPSTDGDCSFRVGEKRRRSDENQDQAPERGVVASGDLGACELTIATPPGTEPALKPQEVPKPAEESLCPKTSSDQAAGLERQEEELQVLVTALTSVEEGGERQPRMDHDRAVLERRYDSACQKIRQLEAENDAMDYEMAAQDRKISSLQDSRSRLTSKVAKLSEDVRRLQQNAFGGLENARWMPLDNSTVSGELSRLRKAMNNFAKTYAAEDLTNLDNLSAADLSGLRELLGSTMGFASATPEALKELRAVRHASRLCLCSLISHYIHKIYFDRPFHFVELEAGNLNIDPTHEIVSSQVLSTIWLRGCRVDEKQSQVWRSDTLRVLYPRHLSSTEAGRKQMNMVESSIEAIAINHVTGFDIQRVSCLLKTMDQSSFQKLTEELTQLFIQAGQLSVQLWCQRPALRCLYLEDLATRRFVAGSEILQPHLLHKHSDPEDTSLDGILPKIVVHPAITSYGTHEAEHYDQHRILEKAVVWLDL